MWLYCRFPVRYWNYNSSVERKQIKEDVFIQSSRLSFTDCTSHVGQTLWISGQWWLPLLSTVPVSLFMACIVIIWKMTRGKKHLSSGLWACLSIGLYWSAPTSINRMNTFAPPSHSFVPVCGLLSDDITANPAWGQISRWDIHLENICWKSIKCGGWNQNQLTMRVKRFRGWHQREALLYEF